MKRMFGLFSLAKREREKTMEKRMDSFIFIMKSEEHVFSICNLKIAKREKIKCLP